MINLAEPCRPPGNFVTRLLLLLSCAFTCVAQAASENRVIVVDPYLELHTGPGRGYPIFHVVERNESVTLLRGKTDWIKLRTADGKEGWAYRDQMERTLAPSGERLRFTAQTAEDYQRRRWELGLLGGDYGGAALITIYAGYTFTPTLSAEFSASQALGDFSTATMAHLNLLSHPFPTWRYSPFFTLGAGGVRTEPRVTLVQARDRSDPTAHVGVGVRTYLTRRFIFRAEYKHHVVFTGIDERNEDIDEWKAGFAFFF